MSNSWTKLKFMPESLARRRPDSLRAKPARNRGTGHARAVPAIRPRSRRSSRRATSGPACRTKIRARDGRRRRSRRRAASTNTKRMRSHLASGLIAATRRPAYALDDAVAGDGHALDLGGRVIGGHARNLGADEQPLDAVADAPLVPGGAAQRDLASAELAGALEQPRQRVLGQHVLRRRQRPPERARDRRAAPPSAPDTAPRCARSTSARARGDRAARRRGSDRPRRQSLSVPPDSCARDRRASVAA